MPSTGSRSGERRCRALLLSLLLLWAPAAAAQVRSYNDGPLKPNDFKMVPPDSPHQAQTSTRLSYTYRYRSRTQPNRAVVTLRDVTLTNQLVQSDSWNRRPQDDELMKHEQGHFDITEVIRRRAAAYFERKAPQIRREARTLDAAVKALEEAMKKEMQPFFDRVGVLQRQYDVETRHGLDAQAQARWREQLDHLLKNPTASIPSPVPSPVPSGE